MVEARPDDWAEVCAALFRSARTTGRARSSRSCLPGKDPRAGRPCSTASLTGYRQNPEAFLWLVENFERLNTAGPKAVLTRLLDLLESALHKPHWIKLRNARPRRTTISLRLAVEQMDEQEATRFVGTVARIKMFDGYVADEIVQLAVTRFPVLDQTHAGERRLHDCDGLEKAKAETAADGRGRDAQDGRRDRPRPRPRRPERELRVQGRQGEAGPADGEAQAPARRGRPGAGPIRAADVDTTEVSVGCKVRLEGKSGSVLEYAILGPWDADHEHGVISYLSPFAQLMMGRKPGDTVEMDGQPYRIAVDRVRPARPDGVWCLRAESPSPSTESIRTGRRDVTRTGGVAVFPTETVYGVGADIRDPAAVARVYEIKKRVIDRPLMAHLADESQLDSCVAEVPDRARELMRRFWPGPLALVFRPADGSRRRHRRRGDDRRQDGGAPGGARSDSGTGSADRRHERESERRTGDEPVRLNQPGFCSSRRGCGVGCGHVWRRCRLNRAGRDPQAAASGAPRRGLSSGYRSKSSAGFCPPRPPAPVLRPSASICTRP